MTPPTPATVNERNTQFWEIEITRRNKRASDPAILQIALRRMNSDLSRGVPLRELPSFEYLLSEAERDQKIALSEHARKGGKSARTDALQELIATCLAKRPLIGVMQLMAELEGEVGAGVVTSIDKPSDLLAGDIPCIHYVNDDGKTKTASIPGLKDRLSRAKRKIKNSH
jgi:hypothetical protein